MKLLPFFLILLIATACQTKNDKSAEDKIKQIYVSEINETFAAFEKRLASNELKTRPWHDLAKGINENFQKIDSIVKTGENYEKIKELLNENITLKWYLEKDSIIHISMDIINDAIKNNKIDKFAYQVLLLELNSKLIQKVYNEIDKSDYKFNKISAVVVPEKSIIRAGEIYRAQIFIGAFDTTQNPTITIDGRPIPIRNGRGIYQAMNQTKGLKQAQGEIEIRNDKNEKVKLPYSMKYEVR